VRVAGAWWQLVSVFRKEITDVRDDTSSPSIRLRCADISVCEKGAPWHLLCPGTKRSMDGSAANAMVPSHVRAFQSLPEHDLRAACFGHF